MKLGIDHEVRRAACPACMKPATGASRFTDGEEVKDDPPEAGDIAVCLFCSSINVYAPGEFGLGLLKMTLKEWDSLSDEERSNTSRAVAIVNYFLKYGQQVTG